MGDVFSKLWQSLQFFWGHRPEFLVWSLVGLVALAVLSQVPVSYNLMNVVVRWRTALLSIFAFTAVVGLMILMLAFVNGMYVLTTSSGQPGNVLLMADGSTDENFSSLAFADVDEIANQPGIVVVDGQPLVSKETFLTVSQLLRTDESGKTKRRFLQLRGVAEPVMSALVHGMTLEAGGRWFSEAGVGPLPDALPDAAPAVEVVLGGGIAEIMGKDRSEAERAQAQNPARLMVGDTFQLNDRTWLVVGVLEKAGSTYDSEVWAKQSLVGQMFGKPNFSTIVVRAPSADKAEKLRQFFLEDFKKAKLAAFVETKYFESLSQTNAQFLGVAIIVAAFTAIGGVFGVMNTMFAAINQRSKDIGVLRLLGYRRKWILLSFLLESLTLALIGGTLGCAVGLLTDGWTVNTIVSGGAGPGKSVAFKMVVDQTVLATGMLLALGMGFIGGLVPAINAMRLTALETLR